MPLLNWICCLGSRVRIIFVLCFLVQPQAFSQPGITQGEQIMVPSRYEIAYGSLHKRRYCYLYFEDKLEVRNFELNQDRVVLKLHPGSSQKESRCEHRGEFSLPIEVVAHIKQSMAQAVGDLMRDRPVIFEYIKNKKNKSFDGLYKDRLLELEKPASVARSYFPKMLNDKIQDIVLGPDCMLFVGDRLRVIGFSKYESQALVFVEESSESDFACPKGVVVPFYVPELLSNSCELHENKKSLGFNVKR